MSAPPTRQQSEDAEVDQLIARYEIKHYWLDAKQIVVHGLDDEQDRARVLELKPLIIRELWRRRFAKEAQLWQR